MNVRFIIRAKNENLRAARVAAGFETVRSLARAVVGRIDGGNEVTAYHFLLYWENFGKYPIRESKYLTSLMEILHVPKEYLFEEGFREAVESRAGAPVEIVKDVRTLAGGPELLLPSHEDKLIEEEDARILHDAIDTLPPRMKKLVKMRYGIGEEEKTPQEIAAEFRVTTSRIFSILKHAERRIRSNHDKATRGYHMREWPPEGKR